MSSSALFLVKAAFVLVVVLGTSYACDTGYTADHGTCYKFYSVSENWDTARQTCQQTGGDLAQIETAEEAAYVQTLRTNTGRANTYYWIGGRQQPHASSPFQWLNGNSINEQLWYTGEPNQVDGQATQCIDLGVPAQQMKMNDYPCSAALNFMCEKKCPSGWNDNQFGSCYKFVNSAKSWSSAKSSCQQLGGTLAILDTQAKAEEMMLLRKNTGNQNNYYWIGAQQETNAKGTFKWINGARFYNGLWFNGEPNQVDFSTQQCVDLGVDGQQYKMNDYSCTASLYYICETGITA